MPNFDYWLQDYLESEDSIDDLIYEFNSLEHFGGDDAQIRQEAIKVAIEHRKRKEKLKTLIKDL
jgi:hypothetical protein